MPEVPGASYEPYFTAQPTERPIPEPNIQAVPAAFGESVARATQLFGSETEQASTEVFNRALALRKMQVEGNIRDLTTQYYMEAAPIQEKFLSAKENGATPEVLQSHMADLESVRQKYAGMAEQYGPYGKNMFGNEAASLQRNFIIRATAHAAEETKKAEIGGNRASMDLVATSWADYKNPKEFQSKVDIGKNLIRKNAPLEGKGADEIADEENKWVQKIRGEQILGLSWDQPKDAMLLLEAHKTELDPNEYAKIRQHVEQRFETVEGNRLAEHAATQTQSNYGSVEDAVRAAKKSVASDPVASQIPGFEDKIASQVRAHIRGQNYDAQQDVNQAQQYILNKLTAPGANYTSLQQLEDSDPQIKKMEEQVRGTKAGALWLSGLPSLVQHNWEKAHSDQMDDNFKQLWGMSHSTDPAVRQEFLSKSADFHEIELKKADWLKLMARREQIISHPETENPILKRAMSLARIGANGETLKLLGVDKLTDSNATKYHKMTGALSIATDEWMNAHDRKVPSDKELNEEIIRPVIRYEGGGWFHRRRAAFDFDIPKKDLANWKQLETERINKTYGQTLTPDQISDEEAYAAATRAIWHNLYTKPKESPGG